ncbi:MAG: transporter substrate-binding domain-containing protein [Muribaculaceae bacterium]|nr:transporter substrate-binding domain-containing protein [Muribaculaceae bacterium]
MIKKILALVVLVMFFCCGCVSKKQADDSVSKLDEVMKRDKIIVGVKTDAYPFGYIDKKGHYAGYDVSLGRLIAKGLFGDEKKVKFVPVTPADRMMKLYSDEVDMLIATMSVTPNRQSILDFSNSYYTSGQALLVRRGSSIKSLRDLDGKRVIIVFGSTAENSIRAAVPNVGIIGYKTYTDAYNALKSGKADAIISDDSILMGFSLNDDSVVLLPKRYSKEPYAVAFKKGDESNGLINAVNSIIDIETKNGTLKNLRKTYGIK